MTTQERSFSNLVTALVVAVGVNVGLAFYNVHPVNHLITDLTGVNTTRGEYVVNTPDFSEAAATAEVRF